MGRAGQYTVAAAVLAAGLLGAGAVQAHARLVTATPAPGSAGAPPKAIELHFSEAVAAKFSHFTLAAADGIPRRLTVLAARDEQTLAAAPAVALAAGSYTVSWVAVASDDGHRTAGSYHFTVK